MADDLQDLLVDRPRILMNHFVDRVAQTCEDVPGLWTAGGDLVEELEGRHGPLSAEVGSTIVSFWTRTSQRAQSAHKHHLDEICLRRHSSAATAIPSLPSRPTEEEVEATRPVGAACLRLVRFATHKS